MKINPGDKVSFLNEKGGGIVKKVVNKIAYIEIEDGFEIPVPINELIVNVSQKKSIDEQPLKKESESNEKIPITESRLHVNNVTYKKNEGVYIAYIPEDKYNILDSGLNIYIVNNTEYSLFYSFNHNFENKYEQVSSGIVNQLSKVHIKKIERDTIEKW
ncbi:MAG: DUF2027 domain-containing protein, partial [Bacteroidota bacterium]|nr:DUF2027 domain-containing protein [Bacteroidota bacterium]